MKKIAIARLFTIVLTLIFTQIKAEVITFKIDKNGKASILLDGKLINKQKYNFQIKEGNTLRFVYINPTSKKTIINITGSSPATSLHINNLQKELEQTDTLSTDNELNIRLKNVSYNLNEPFKIRFGVVGEPNNLVETEITPNIVPSGPANSKTEDITSVNTGPVKKAENIYKPGSAVYDALKLSNSKMVSETELKGILQYYYPDSTLSTKNDVWKATSKNPFLAKVLNSTYQLKSGGTNSQSAAKINLASAFSALGGLDVTTLTDGMAKFLVKRVKEELSIAFFEKLQKAIKAKPDLITLFPKTADLLGSIQDDAFDYQKYLQNLRETFKKDIEALDTNLPGIIDNHEAFFKRNHSLAAAVYGGSYITSELKKQVHPGDILQNYPLSTLKQEDASYTGAVKTLQLLSESLRDTASSDSTYWVNIKYLRQLVNNKEAFRIYLGLIYQLTLSKYDSIQLSTAKNTLITVLDQAGKNYSKHYDYYKVFVLQFGERTQTLNKMIKSYQRPPTDSLAVELYKNYFDATIDLIKYTAKVGSLLKLENTNPETTNSGTEFLKYLNVVSQVSDLVIDINRKNYSSAVNQTVLIYNLIKTHPLQAELDNVRKTKDEGKIKIAADSLAFTRSTTANLAKYGSFMAAMAMAKNSDEAASSIASFVLPSGSSRIKRESPFNVAVNAYTGLFYGHEAIQGLSNNPFFNSYGVTAPIGINIGWGQTAFFAPFFGKGHSSASFFLSLVDIGAVAAFRFKDSQTAEVPKIELRNILSPGLFLSLGIPRTPLSVNIGAQTGPNLREVNLNSSPAAAENPKNQTYWRYSLSVVVDIPLLNLYTKSK